MICADGWLTLMASYPVGLRVNSPRNNDAACVAPLAV